MNDREILGLANKCSVIAVSKHEWDGKQFNHTDDLIEGDAAGLIQFAKLLMAVEREACAKLLENGRFLHDEAPAAILAKEAAKAIRVRGDVHASDISQERVDETAKSEHEFECPRCGHCCREWVGLTDGEMVDLLKEYEGRLWVDVCRAIEAKLKEKNGG